MKWTKLVLFPPILCFAQVKSTDTSITNTGNENVNVITYKTDGRRDSMVYLYKNKGRLFIPTGHGSMGRWKFYSKSEKLRYEYSLNNHLKNGPYIVYDNNGRVAAKYFYIDGKRSGTSTEYYSNGNIRILGNFENGQKAGTLKQYYPSGKLLWTGQYRRNRMYGERIYYLETGEFINGLSK